MPLIPGSTKDVVSRNISEMVKAGHPHDQAVAASLHNAGHHSMAKKAHPKAKEIADAYNAGAPPEP